MNVCIAAHEGMQAAWTAEQQENFKNQMNANAGGNHQSSGYKTLDNPEI